MEDGFGSVRRVIVGAAQMFSSNAIVSLLGLINMVIFARYLGTDDFGAALAVVATIGALTGWGGLGLEEFLSIDAARETGEGRDGTSRRLLRQYVGIRVLTTAILTIGLLSVGGAYLGPRLGVSSGSLRVALFLLVVGQSFSFVSKTVFFSYQRFKLVAGASVVEALTRTAVALALFLGAGRTPVIAILAYGAGACAGVFAFLPALRGLLTRQVLNHEEGLTLRRAVSGHGKWALVANLIKRGADPVPDVLLAGVAGPAALATYRVASRLVEVIQLPINVVGEVLAPVVASNLASARELTARITKYCLGLAVVLTAAGLLLARPLIVALFSPAYEQSAVVALVLMPAVVSVALRIRQRPLMASLRRQDLLLLSYVLVVPLEIGFAGLATILWGVVGFAAVRVGATFAIFGVREYQLRRAGQGIKFRESFKVDSFDWLIVRKAVTKVVSKVAPH